VESVKDLEELREILLAYDKIKKENGVKSSFIFLDEVSSLKEWWRVLKSLIDMGFFQEDAIVATGSSSLNILKERESFPGRRVYFEFFPLHAVYIKN
jgi:predicted AAA+ superfamily ATPase